MLTRLHVLASRIRGVFSGRALDEDFDREIRSHLSMLTDDYIRRGMPPDRARRAAILRFGGPVAIKEQHRDDRGLPLVDATLQDVRYALRTLRKNAGLSQNPATFVMRSTVDTEALISAVRQNVRAVDRDLLLTDVTTMNDLVRDATGDERFRTTLLSLFAGVALFLAALGIYGVLAYFVSQRSRELGIRLALGARPTTVFSLVVRQGMQPVAAGVVVGLIAALGFTGTIQSLLFGITPLDPTTHADAITTLAAAALIACALPAARATSVDPLVALRDE